MVSCSVAGCNNRPGTKKANLRYYSFPKDPKVCKEWINACGKNKPFKFECARVCSQHFVQNDFNLQDVLLKIPENKRRLRNGAVPSENLPFEIQPSRREKKRIRMENKAIVEECLASYERQQQEGINEAEGNTTTPINSRSSYSSTVPQSSKKLKIVNKQEDTTILELSRDPLERNIALQQLPDDHSYSHIKYYTNGSTQTEVDFECCKELHIMRLEAQNRRLKSILKKQLQRAQEHEAMRCSLRKIMTVGQINRLQHPGKKSKWKSEDIASAMMLYKAGPMAYELLRKKDFPLPSSSTLRCWAGKIDIKPGFLDNIFQLMAKLKYDATDRLCVLCFNKMRLKASTYKSANSTMPRARFAHIVMVRGLIAEWTQIIYYDLDTTITATVLYSIIAKLDEINYIVTAVSSDMGPTTTDLMQELCVSENEPFFLHPNDESKQIFFFVDVLHLLKLLRNRLIDCGFLLYGYAIDTGPIKVILDTDPFSIPISREHIEVSKLGREKINLASQLISNTVSVAIRRCVTHGIIESPDAMECADFIHTISDWFQLFNSKYISADPNDASNAYGMALELQTCILELTNEKIRNLKASKKQGALRFQSGILINNSALPRMLNYLNENYNISYILTERLNHEELENFFNLLRSKGGPINHPTPVEFKYRLRSSVMGKIILE